MPESQHTSNSGVSNVGDARENRLGDYELLEELGHGAMGVVYRARHVFLNQIVAVKVLPPRYVASPGALARFRREMQSLGGLDHPNIVHAYNAGESEGRQFLVMEYVDGLNLHLLVSDRVAKGTGPLPVGAACEAIRQAAGGLHYANEKRLVHRDIKPANLVLSRSGVVKILDLGLAKLRSRPLAGEERSGPLTQAGTTIGTVDYMAPEQWEDSSAVDIRADIYSLGCTLFFLLTGRPPFGGETYDTLRSKLVAHAAGPTPSLAEARPGTPAELDRILTRMMAKSAADRFADPAAVADALRPFAEPDSLAGLLADAFPVHGGPASDQQTRDWASETPRESDRSLRGGEARAAGGAAGRRLRAAAVAGVCVLAALVGALVWRARNPAVADPPVSAALKLHRDNLALLPGLNGQWWFDETPWYAPFVRQAVYDAITTPQSAEDVLGERPDKYFSADTLATQQWLWEVVARCEDSLTEPQKQLLDDLKAVSESDAEDSAAADPLEEALRKFVESRQEQEWTAVERHTQALLEHKLASVRVEAAGGAGGNRRLADDAKAHYDEALSRYAPTDPLRRLCLADSALLCSRLLDDYKEEGSRRFREALEAAEPPALFNAATFVAQGTEAASHAGGLGDYEIGLFDNAQSALSKVEGQTIQSHPLMASVNENHAWSLMDLWKVDKAFKLFSQALGIRESNRRDSKNALSIVYELHNRHGQAIARRYGGDLNGAHADFRRLVGTRVVEGGGPRGEIEDALDAARQLPNLPGRQRHLRNLQERWANSAERWADCELYGGAAAGAAVNLHQACKLYDHARRTAPDSGTKFVMTCKYCMALTLCGDCAKAAEIFAGEIAPVKAGDILGVDRQRAVLVRQVTAAVLALKSKENSDRGAELRSFLAGFTVSRQFDATRRETLELRLFAAELLLAHQLQANGGKAVGFGDIAHLDQLLTVMREREQASPFLHRYYELIVRAVGRDKPVQMAQYLLAARASARAAPAAPGATHVVFHFASPDDPQPNDNYAILAPTGTLVPLPFGRREIRSAASGGRSLALPPALLKAIDDEHKAGRKTVLSWNDDECFCEPSQGLSKFDWKPFAGQLDYETLHNPTPSAGSPR